MKTDKELVEFCVSKINTPYVFGMKGKKLTQEKLDELSWQNPKIYTAEYKKLASRYLGEVCTDCSGLISWCTGIVRGSSEYHDTAVVRKGFGSLNESMIGWALWKPGHIGVYIGNGYCVEAKGIRYGTIRSLVSKQNWKEVLKLKDIKYGENAPEALPVLVKKQGWLKEDGRWRYYQDDNPVKNDWLKSPGDGQWYWFDDSGYAVSGQWITYKGKRYYLQEDCSMVTGFAVIEKTACFFDENGALTASGFLAYIYQVFLKKK